MRRTILAILLASVAVLSAIQPALAACSGTACVINDTFSRTVNSGFGTANTGGSWTMKWYSDGSSANGNSNVGSGEGHIGFDEPGSTDMDAIVGVVGTSTYTDTDQILTVEVSDLSGDTNLVGPMARVNSNQNAGYAAVLDFANGGFVIYYVDSGTWFDLASQTGLSLSADTYYNIRFKASGTTLSAKYWAVGTSEPTGENAWNLTVTDSSYSSGKAGAAALLNHSTTVDFYVDEFGVRDCATYVCGQGDSSWTS